MKLWAISDLHVGYRANLFAIGELEPRPRDWLVLCGDVGDTLEQVELALRLLNEKFSRLLWVPGNHELWTVPRKTGLRGVERYEALVDLCRRHDVLTPEDPFPLWTGDGGPHVLAPLFVLYDYSFRPDDVNEDEAVAWAEESGIVCSDEYLIRPEPYASLPDWCRARLTQTLGRLEETEREGLPLILVNHYPLRRDLLRLRRIPRFSIWCGTTATEDWHTRFGASVVVYGHLHVKGTHFRDGVRFEEVSLGYPRDWNQSLGLGAYLRQILPAP